MSEWQPIETAPLHGDVLLWNGVRVFLGWYAEGEGWSDSTNQDRDDYPENPQPTHWMPLPTPPTEQAEERAGGPDRASVAGNANATSAPSQQEGNQG